MRDYEDIQREIDESEGRLFARGVNVFAFGRAADLELAAALGVEPPLRMPADLEALYDERDAVGGARLRARAAELRRLLGAAGFGAAEGEAVLGCYSLDGRRVDAIGQYFAGGGEALARGDWGTQADRVRWATGLSRPEAFAAVVVVSSYFGRAAA